MPSFLHVFLPYNCFLFFLDIGPRLHNQHSSFIVTLEVSSLMVAQHHIYNEIHTVCALKQLAGTHQPSPSPPRKSGGRMLNKTPLQLDSRFEGVQQA